MFIHQLPQSTVCQMVEDSSVRSEFRVQLDSVNGFSEADFAKLKAASCLMESVIRSEEFREHVYAFTWEGGDKFADNRGLSNVQIYEMLQEGREAYSDDADQVANLRLKLYSPPFFKRWGVVGYGFAGDPMIFINKNYFHIFSLAEVAGNFAHEWCHKLGFEHDFRRTAKRPYSVPYGIGKIVTDLALKY